MKTILREWRKDPKACWMLVGYFLMSSANIVINAYFLIMLSEAINDLPNLTHHLCRIAFWTLVQVVTSAFSSYWRTMSNFHCFSQLSNRWCQRILEADYQLFTSQSPAHINTVAEFTGRMIRLVVTTVDMGLNVIRIGVNLGAIYLLGRWIILPVLGIYAVGAVVIQLVNKRYWKLDQQMADQRKRRNQEQEDIILGFAEVRSFGTQRWHRERVQQFNADIFHTSADRTKVGAWCNAAICLVDGLGSIPILLYAAQQIGAGLMNAAQGLSLVVYGWRIIDPLMIILDYVSESSDARAMIKDFEAIMNAPRTVQDGSGSMVVGEFQDRIELRDVGFAYGNTSKAISHVDLTIHKGEKVALVGASGGGKSTLVKLLCRFYRPTQGQILVDGVDINQMELESYSRFLGSMQQSSTIFPGTIRENVMYGTPKATELEMVQACEKAHILEFIQGLPDRFDTKVGPRGLTLSGGQQQRIALARLILRNPQVLVLDEATSALDNESERAVQQAIDEMRDKTLITVAHRLSTIQNYDRICVIGPQGVLESGSHKELVARGGIYYKMLNR